MAEEDSDSFHFAEPIPDADFVRLLSGAGAVLVPGSVARDEALELIAAQDGLMPIGMLIGPFSLVTRLMKDPITAAGLAGGGMTAEDATEVRLLMQCLEVAEKLVLRSAPGRDGARRKGHYGLRTGGQHQFSHHARSVAAAASS